MNFRPSFKAQAIQSAVVATGIAVCVALALYFYFGVKTMSFVIGISTAGGLGFFAIYIVRYLWEAPRLVRVTEDGLSVMNRTGETLVNWSDVGSAFLKSEHGLLWRLELATGSIIVRDDGFSHEQWTELSHAIEAQLTHHAIALERDEYGEALNVIGPGK